MAGKELKSSLNKKSQMISNYSYKRCYYYYCDTAVTSLLVWLAAGKLPAGNVQLENRNKLEGGEDDTRGSTIAHSWCFLEQ